MFDLQELASWLSPRHGERWMHFRSARMGVDIATYCARIGGFVLGNKMESGMLKKGRRAALPKCGLQA
jgi:hypothetical protein